MMRSIPFVLALGISLVCANPLRAQLSTSSLIRGAVIIDGTGAPRYAGDVRIVGDRIAEVGSLTPRVGESIIDARGLVLAPGFIDTHSHHDRDLLTRRDALPLVTQGVTTIVVGQDGSGMNLEGLFSRLTSTPVAVNVASYVGHGSVRRAVMGTDFARAATAAEIERMKELVRVEMRAGSLGLSTGLEYDPGIYSTREEVLALARVAAESGGRYISHIRSEDRELWGAIDEIIAIGRSTGMPVQVSHIKLAMLDWWGQADRLIRVLDAARASGVQITADIYPYEHWQSNLGVFYPKRNFADTAETAFVLAHVSPAADITFSSFPAHPEYAGKTVAQIAAARGASAVQTMTSLLAEPGGSGAGIIAKGMLEADEYALLRWPFTNICSDGQFTGLHPRGFGSFPRVLGPYVRDKKLLGLEEAVRKMTSLAAQNVGIKERGSITPGAFADLVLFDPATIADRATFETPQAQAVGVRTVWVNGRIVFDNDKITGVYAGRPLRR
jgi:N-acyl-D-amino-acid deacylase